VVKEAKGGVANRVEQHCRQRPVLMTEAQPMPPIEKGVRLRTAPAFINETLKGFRAHHDIFSLGCSFLNEVAGSALVGVFFFKLMVHLILLLILSRLVLVLVFIPILSSTPHLHNH
jgi:hypothetical protein